MERLGGDHASLEAQLHFLKGSALNLGFADFSDLCSAGETRAAHGATDIDLDEIARCYAASQKAFLEGLAARYAA
jgi:HPt (histidine-containing phosphotransfer) domain-containing protein